MKIKQFQNTVVSTWSPKSIYPINIAMGTAAQQLDASFNTSSTLELYTIQQSNDVTLNASISADCRFHKLVWGGANSHEDWDSGIIVGGCDNGVIRLYNASKLARNMDSIVAITDRHVGSVKALSFNLNLTNLFASGASESEIFIWDLNCMSTPMTPGSKSETLENVIDLAWNNEVQHILGSLFPNYTVIWDLRNNRHIFKISNDNSKIKWKAMSWNPKVTTQVCIASENDENPVIQLWDLRHADSPVKNLVGHQKGILSIAWCSEDPDLLISCGKDNKLLMWNPNSETNENVCELEHNHQWNFEVNWCPRDPLLVATSSFDGQTTIYSLNDLQKSKEPITSENVTDVNSPLSTVPSLINAPKWLQRNCGSSFAFGGQLVSFDGSLKKVQLNNAVIESDLLLWSEHLRKILKNENFEDFCHNKSELTPDNDLQLVWKFLKSMFHNNPREAQLEILGYSTEKISNLASQCSNNINGGVIDSNGDEVENGGFHSNNSSSQEEQKITTKFANFNLQSTNSNDVPDSIYQLLLVGNLSTAADLFLDNGKPVEALLLAITAGPKTLSRIQNKYLKNSKEPTAALLHAIVTNDWNNLVENCDLNCWKEIMTALFTHTTGTSFVSYFEKLGNRLSASDDHTLSKYAQLCYICSGNVEALINIKKDIKTVEKLQECVEMAMMLFKSKSSTESNLGVGQTFGELLVKYSETLVSQGDLEGALSFLEFTNKDQGVELKDQLYKTFSAQDSRKYSTGTITPEPPFQSYPNKFIQPNNSNQYPTPSFPNHAQNMKSHPQPTNNFTNPMNQQNNTVPLPPMHSTPTPPADFDHRSQTPSSNKPGRPKYVIDPSIKGNNMYANFNNGPGMPSQGNPLSQKSGFSSQIQQQNYLNQPLGPQRGFDYQMQQPHALNQPFGQQGGLNSPIGPPLQPQNQSYGHQSDFNPPMGHPSILNPPMGQPSILNPPMGQPSILNPPMGQPSILNPPMGQPNILNPSLGQNFNDPLNQKIQPNIYNPASAQTSRFNQHKSYDQLPNLNQKPTFQPIQNPLNNFSSGVPPSPNFNQPPSIYNQRAPSVDPLHPSMSYVKKTNAAGWNDPPMLSTSAPIQKPPTPVSSAPITHPLYTNNPPPIEETGTYIPLQNNYEEQYNTTNNIAQGVEALPKQPIPEEHVRIQLILEGLQSRLLEAAPTAQTRKRVSDIARKLELLYDSLRENSLSPYLIQCLHALLDLVLKRDFNGALSLHTQLVSGPEFSKISTFMPSLKTLFQMIYQYNINLEGL